LTGASLFQLGTTTTIIPPNYTKPHYFDKLNIMCLLYYYTLLQLIVRDLGTVSPGGHISHNHTSNQKFQFWSGTSPFTMDIKVGNFPAIAAPRVPTHEAVPLLSAHLHLLLLSQGCHQFGLETRGPKMRRSNPSGGFRVNESKCQSRFQLTNH